MATVSDFLFTSESVSEGHPDKVCDQISDSILDAMLAEDPSSRVACETLVTTGLVIVAGEIRSKAKINISDIARKTITDIGYNSSEKFFDGNTCAVMVTLDRQSPDIAQGVDRQDPLTIGAGDQGIMFGYAVNETPEFMPLSISLSHRLLKDLSSARKSGKAEWLRPDAKSQVTVKYENGAISQIDTVVISTQHAADKEQKDINDWITEEVIYRAIPSDLRKKMPKIFVNPTGRFVVGGPMGDCGLTGRKIIVDTYGGHGAHGGGAFSGKDPSKVDRSAAYAARHIAKNLVASGVAQKCLVQLSYAIGVAEPTSLMVQTYGTGKVDDDKIVAAVKKLWDLRPGAIIRDLDLLKPRYQQTASYGHFGRSEDGFTWEKLDKVEALKAELSLK